MSHDHGKPVYLTNGERRLLEGLILREIDRLGGDEVPAGKEDRRMHKLRLRQWRRLLLEIRAARAAPPGDPAP